MGNINRLSGIQAGYTLKISSVPGTGTWIMGIPANPNRWALTISTGGFSLFIFPSGAPGVGQGIPVNSSSNPPVWTFVNNPALTTAEWWFNAGGGNNVYFFEEIFTG
jgi:hypothetical protein